MSKTTNAHVDLFAFADTVCDLADVGAVVMGDINFASKVYGKLTKSGPSFLSAIGEFAGMGDDYTPDYFAGTDAGGQVIDPKRLDQLVARVDDLIKVSDAWLNSMHPFTFAAAITAVRQAVITAKQFQKQFRAGLEKAKTDTTYLPKWIELGNSLASLLHTCPDALWKDSTVAGRLKLLLDDLLSVAKDIVQSPAVAAKADAKATVAAVKAVGAAIERGANKVGDLERGLMGKVVRYGAVGLVGALGVGILWSLCSGKATAKAAGGNTAAALGWEIAGYTAAPALGVGLGYLAWKLLPADFGAKKGA